MSKIRVREWIALAVLIGNNAAHAQTLIPPSPKDFVMTASQTDQYELLAAKVAEVQGQDARVRAYAHEMVQDYMHLGEDLRQAALASKLPPPEGGMSSDQAGLLSSLQSVRGADFDNTYARQQELAHAQAVAVVESFATNGSDQNLRKAAQSALPFIRDHLKKAQQLRADVGGS